ncbi:hypothetical protein DIPPA_06077 [Diplonema papillatum]|nr:hypothetical protein DIPPA_06077 [Diplonema papillatum]
MNDTATSSDLITNHRERLAAFGTGTEANELSGVTLSRRQRSGASSTQPPEQATAYSSLAKFTFGDNGSDDERA